MPHPARPIPNRMCLAGRATRARGKTVCRLTAPSFLRRTNRLAAVASPNSENGVLNPPLVVCTRPGRAMPEPNSARRPRLSPRLAALDPPGGFFIRQQKNPAARERWPGLH